MVKTIPLVCPKCGAELNVDETLTQCFCQYCGTKMMIDKGETVLVVRDEAKIIEAEANARIRQQELELLKKDLEQAAKNREKEEKRRKRKAIILVILTVIDIILCIVYLKLCQSTYIVVAWAGLLFVLMLIYMKMIMRWLFGFK